MVVSYIPAHPIGFAIVQPNNQISIGEDPLSPVPAVLLKLLRVCGQKLAIFSKHQKIASLSK